MSFVRNIEQWAELVAGLPSGKRVADAVYLHRSALPTSARHFVEFILEHAGIPENHVTVCKFHAGIPRLSLLYYPGFFSVGFPKLQASWTVDATTGDAVERRYDQEGNPPVLHRKEQMLPPDHPERELFARLTSQAEAAGLFDDAAIIGHALAWEEELRARGLEVREHSLIAATAAPNANEWRALRHRTALARTGLSSPVQSLWRHGFLTSGVTFFDYGCGRGDDVALLSDREIAASGWDPWFRAEAPRVCAEVVNLGFVLNVIEDLAERRAALDGAWRLAGRVLAVAALIGGRTAQDRWRLFQDGVLTSIGTFQKYYSHAELGTYIFEVLERPPVAVQPGVYFVFRRDDDEQDFLERRQRTSARGAPPWAAPELRRAKERVRRGTDGERAPRRVSRWTQHADLVESFWRSCCEYARIPDASEWAPIADVVTCLGRPETALRHLLAERGPQDFEAATRRRTADLRVYLALQLFERRASFNSLSGRLQRDIRAFWGSQGRALDDARTLLFAAGSADEITSACESAHDLGHGWLERDPSGSALCLYCLTARIQELAPVLRVYAGCAERLYGDLRAADAIKIHIRSAKLTSHTYDDFWRRSVPDLVERVKVDLRRQEIDVFGYGSEQFPPQPLWKKSRIMGAAAEGYDKQVALEASIESATGLDFGGYGPSRAEAESALAATGRCDLLAAIKA